MLQEAAGSAWSAAALLEDEVSAELRCALLSCPHPTEASRKETETIKGKASQPACLLHGLDRCGVGKDRGR